MNEDKDKMGCGEDGLFIVYSDTEEDMPVDEIW